MLYNLSYWAPELHGSVATWLRGYLAFLEQLCSVNDEMEDGDSLLNQANDRPYSVIAKALHRMGS